MRAAIDPAEFRAAMCCRIQSHNRTFGRCPEHLLLLYVDAMKKFDAMYAAFMQEGHDWKAAVRNEGQHLKLELFSILDQINAETAGLFAEATAEANADIADLTRKRDELQRRIDGYPEDLGY